MAWPSASARTKTWGTEILTSGDLDGQFDILHQYNNDQLNGTTGHQHTGGTSEGPILNLASAVNISGQTQGDIIYASNSTTLARLGAGTAGQALTTGGASANPAWAGMTTQGDIEYFNGTTRTRLGPGTSGQFLQTQGAGANPQWTTAGGFLGAWASATVGSNVQATTDGFLVVAVTSAATGNVSILTDSNSTPSTTRSSWTSEANGSAATLFTPVRKNDYYKIANTGATINSAYFIPLGA